MAVSHSSEHKIEGRFPETPEISSEQDTQHSKGAVADNVKFWRARESRPRKRAAPI